MQSFARFFDDSLNLDSMLQRIRQMLDEIPAYMGQIIKFACLTGLRPAEAVQSVKLINDKDSFGKYYNPQRQAFGYWTNNAATPRQPGCNAWWMMMMMATIAP
jgi:hypothetical protein